MPKKPPAERPARRQNRDDRTSRAPKARQNLPGFPPAWTWFMDEMLPQWVKDRYSPREGWKGKPFGPEDARFFFRGIEELSDLFTEERPRAMPAYFNHPKYRSAYLLYFLPLQAAKFIALFQLHPHGLKAALEHGRQQGVLRVADLGAGPGTASLALLLEFLSDRVDAAAIPQIEFHWFDTAREILEDGRALVETLSGSFPKLRGKVRVHTHVMPWWRAASALQNEMSLVFLGNVLNEGETRRLAESESAQKQWSDLLGRAGGGGLVFLEPAARKPSQQLSQLRDELLDLGLLRPSASSIWGPCLHAGSCPLAAGRDWCHFSVPVEIPGRLFLKISEGLGSERQWVKFSYLWLASPAFPNQGREAAGKVRVISDPIREGVRATVLICEPDLPQRMPVPSRTPIRRGDLIAAPRKL